MSFDPNTHLLEYKLEWFEEYAKCSYEKFERAGIAEKFLILLKTPGTNAQCAMKVYIELLDLLGK